MENLNIEIVIDAPIITESGLGRYTQEIFTYLQEKQEIQSIRLVQTRFLPFNSRFTMLRAFPVGLIDHQKGNIIHFPKITGASILLWRSYHPTIATVHDLGVLVVEEDKVLFTKLDRKLLDLHYAGLRQVDNFFVHSLRTRQHLIDVLKIEPERIHVVPSSVDLKAFRPIQNAVEITKQKYAYPLDDGSFNMIYVGSELPRKNLAMMLSAISILKSRGYKVRLIKIGSPGGAQWREATSAKVKELGIDDNVLFTGFIPEEDLPLLYSACDISVTSTLLEGGFAWTVMEAHACGRPSVASTSALVPEEAVGKTALVVPDHDAESMANAIQKLIDSPELLKDMGKAAYGYIQQFTWYNECARMVEVYRKLEKAY